MSDALLPYYVSELHYVRELASEFAAAHPAVAESLGISSSANEAKDPHVERLIEAFAYLTARVRHKLDDDFPELIDGLLSVLYPLYQSPVPSMAILQMALDRSQSGLTAGFTAAAGATVETDAGGELCKFRTCYPVSVWPVEVAGAAVGVLPPDAKQPAGAPAALRLELQCIAKDQNFANMKMPRLRFFLNAPPQFAFPLYELIFNNLVDVAVLPMGANGRADVARMKMLGAGTLRSVGFDEDHGVLPYTLRSFPGYRLLAEYFVFPQKFLFFDVDFADAALAEAPNKIELRIFLARSGPELERVVSADTFRLGCVPIINLYSQRAEPFRLTQTSSEYHVIPDARRPMVNEIHSVDSVTMVDPEGESFELTPFYASTHDTSAARQKAFFHTTRRPRGWNDGKVDHGTEIYLSLVDLGFGVTAPRDWTVLVETTCLNRDLPQQLPWGAGQPRMTFADGGPVTLQCLTRPTPTLRKELQRGSMWRLISHLSLNYLSITGGEDGAAALREILRLYNLAGTADSESKIAGVLEVQSRRITARAGGVGAGGVCRGVEVTVKFDEDRYADNGIFLFASVLEKFFGLYCSVNSFSQTVATTKQREGVLRRWAPRAGQQPLL